MEPSSSGSIIIDSPDSASSSFSLSGLIGFATGDANQAGKSLNENELGGSLISAGDGLGSGAELLTDIA